jgi:hypothetical protein
MESELVRRLEAELADLRRRMPRHSAPPSLVERLEELEEALADALAGAPESEDPNADGGDRR